MRQAQVFRNDTLVGILSKDEQGQYHFYYLAEYLSYRDARSISVNLPLQEEPFVSDILFPFFFNLLSEGSIKAIQCRELKIDPQDYFTLLLRTANRNTIGSITLKEIEA